ncbi:MAG: hypothetical protein H8E66_29160 [Planctomycetes bacterium]|nr:hypothetical protein [Planctomycetota bacterium]
MFRSSASWHKWATSAILFTLATNGIEAVRAQDFRVDTDVFLGGDEETFSEHLTLFRGPVVYDFAVKGPDEITILNLQNGTVTLLDVKRRTRTDVTTADLLEFSARIKAIGTEKQGKDLVAPQFVVKFDEEQSLLELASRKITYSATAMVPAAVSTVERYREFTDWYARLNSMRPPNPPHFGRLELNRELAERGLLPKEIERTISLGRPFSKPQRARSQHVVQMAISGTDRRRIDKAGGYLVSFKKVSKADYMQPAAIAAR